MLTRSNKAIAAALLSAVLLVAQFGLDFGLGARAVAVAVALVLPLLVWIVPDRPEDEDDDRGYDESIWDPL